MGDTCCIFKTFALERFLVAEITFTGHSQSQTITLFKKSYVTLCSVSEFCTVSKILVDNKLSCCRETVQCFVSLNTLLSHSRSLKNNTVE